MTKIFYDHLIKIEEVCDELNHCEINIEERQELTALIDETIDNKMLSAILDILPQEFHETFLKQFHQTPYDENLLGFLKEKVKDIEDKIQEKAKEIKKELLAEIKKAKKRSADYNPL